MLINGIDVDYEEDIDDSNNHYPIEIINETEEIDFAIYILQDRCKKLSKKGLLYSKISKCIEYLEFLKKIDDEYTWLGREKVMLQFAHEEACRDNKELYEKVKELESKLGIKDILDE